ncbi:ATP-binding cassette domain-containing protein [Paucibacter sp. APW11]|uniref:ATP-binding cassette domain-containing protein n=1 Tax=Roseateles aquae TaxID=3077235 RepID=A0ABU3PET5_9BURK|nr:ATP-binding cassette domain-containing protein [Paucibacter sp. APW11]MDT9001112.1 ATP-binding cassette domain-containing protein [Paucibacter sp. APW11]
MLNIKNLVKVYPPNVRAVDDVSLTLERGVVGLIGHNGAGKTTLLDMLCTLSRPTAGQILFDGVDIVARPDAMRQRLGFLPQNFGAQANLTAQDFLAYLAALKGVRDPARVRQCLELVNLQDCARRRMTDFSGGMRRRLGIAQALLGDPDFVVVDEPTTGLDLDERMRFRALMAELGRKKLVLISTHIVSDIENIASALLVMDRGKLLAQTEPQRLLAQLRGNIWSLSTTQQHYEELRESVHVLHVLQHSGGVDLRLAHRERPCAQALPLEPSLEDALLAFPRLNRESTA